MIQPVRRGAQILGVLGSGIPRLGVLTGQTKTTRAAPTQVRGRGYEVADREAAVGGGGIAASLVSRGGVALSALS